MKKYDLLIVGTGLYGAVTARQARDAGRSVLMLDRRDHIAGNVFTENVQGIDVHRYGAHIFHTNSQSVWNYVNRFAVFNRFTNSPVANFRGELYSLPFNMYTFNRMWGVVTPEEARQKIEEQKRDYISQKQRERGISPTAPFDPKNLEEQAISLVGTDIYEKLIKGYTHKQWGRPCTELPSFIIKRLPVRFTFDNNYFNARYQGIPEEGYTGMVENMLEGAEIIRDGVAGRAGNPGGKLRILLGVDYLNDREMWNAMADKVVYTGALDAFFDYSLGHLQYRSVRFETELLDIPNFQGNAAVNYTDEETPWTRIIEHKWFKFGKDKNGADIPVTVISREYSSEWKPGDEPYYPVNDERNSTLCAEYQRLAGEQNKVVFGGRLGQYRYYDMDQVIAVALKDAEKLLS